MSAVSLAESVRVADHSYAGHTSTPSASKPRRRRSAPGRPAATAQPVIDHIHALMREHGVTLSELGAVYTLSRIHVLMARYGITIDELRGEVPAAQQAPQREVRITRCPSVNHDPRYQLPPGTQVADGFMAEWNRLRGVSG